MDENNDEEFTEEVQELINKFVAPKIEQILKTLMEKKELSKESFAKEFYKKLFTKSLRTKFENLGLNIEDCVNVEINMFHCDDLSKDINDEGFDAEEFQEFVESQDRYKVLDKQEGILNFKAYEVKPRLTINDVDPVTNEELKRMFDKHE